MNEITTIGVSEKRVDAWAKVYGTAQYVSDITAKQVKFGVIVRSTHHHARIISLDISDALQIPGVITILTYKDIPGVPIYGEIIPDRPVLANDKVRFFGEPVAVIVAENLATAEQGREAVKIIYEPLPPVFDPEEALSSSTAAIHTSGNLCSKVEITYGDTHEGFNQADVTIEETFQVARIYPGYLEPEANLAQWQKDGKLIVWVSSQMPFHDRTCISRVLGIPEADIVVKSAIIGGAFGGKEDASLAILTALAAWKIKGSVKIVNTRAESILAHPKRHPAVLHYKLGAKADGTFTALQARVFLDTGAYASLGPAVAQLLTETVTGPYRIPNVTAETYLCYTNSPVSGAMRGFGSPQTNFAYESLINILAEKMNIDADEICRKNIWQPGDQSFTCVKINQLESLARCLELAQQERDRLQKIPPTKDKAAGVGYALAVQTMGLGRGVPDDSTNKLEWLQNGDILLRIGAPDLGQGLFTVAAQIAADELGLSYDRVKVENIDTSLTPDGGTSCASRMTYMVGNSVMLAAQQAVEMLKAEASRILLTDKNQFRYHKGLLYQEGEQSSAGILASEITSRLAEDDKKIEAVATFSFPYSPDTPDHLPVGMPHVLFCFGAQVVRVEVDQEIGKVEITDVVAIHDVGKAINKAAVEGQIEGGVATGIGYALSEEVALKADQRWVDGFAEYLLPTSMDVPPEIKSIILEYPEATGPHGVKGIGEISLVPTAAAISNAIYTAVGYRAKELPIRSERLINKTAGCK